MVIIDELIDDYRIKKYGKLALNYNCSNLMLTGSKSEDSIRMEKLLLEAKSTNTFIDSIVRNKLNEDYNVDFLDLSLISGLYLGVYNIYCYKYIKKDVRKTLSNSNIERDKSLKFLENNSREIYKYLNEKYEIDEELFTDIISKLFVLRQDYSLYNNEVVFDILFLLMGKTLYDENFKSDEFISCEKYLDYFKEENEKSYLIH
jgi:hypothetical protein